jgi:ABC-type sugar transport system ATPase subunit
MTTGSAPHGDRIGAIALSTRALVKSFGPTRALVDADVDLVAGEIHALVGENGSGKSTLVKILSGVHRPDRGVILRDGTERTEVRSPRQALSLGIATVFQEVLAVPPRSVLDNLWLGADRGSARRRRDRARAVLAELLETPPSLDAVMEDLSLSDRQVCSIARALLREPDILILDEATSSLDYDARTRLFHAVRARANRGTAVVLITHRMDEIDEIADRITVMRSGETVATLARGEWTTPKLVSLMTGSDSLTDHVADRSRAAVTAETPVVLSARGIRLTATAAPIDFDIREGEVVGLAGLEGHGQDAFLRALWGGTAASGDVVRRVGGREQAITSSHRAAANGIAYVPRDRRTESIFERLSILDNFALPTIGRYRRGGLINDGAIRARLLEYRDRLAIKFGRVTDEIRTLSGGNQQKVVLARWLALEPRILLLNDPTRGIDINAKRDLYAALGALAQTGVSIVMLSTEVDEHVELMDRVLVFREHAIVRELAGAELSRDALVRSYFDEEVPSR